MPRAVMKSTPTLRFGTREIRPRVAATEPCHEARFTDGDGGRERGSSRSPSLLSVVLGRQQIDRIEVRERAGEQ